jgi:excisionase family DNA binding protein
MIAFLTQLFRRDNTVYDNHMPLEPQNERTYSVSEAAELMNVSRQRIHQLRQEGRIDAVWDGAYWRILEHSIGNVRPSARPVGRPQKRHKK